jgi:hypothetical protein
MTTPPTLSAAVIESGRLVLRKVRDTDREGIVEVLTDPEVRAYLGGPGRREDVEQFLDRAGTADTTAAVGSYVIADRQADRFADFLVLSRHPAAVPGMSPARAGNWSCPTCCGATPGAPGWRSRPRRPRCAPPPLNCPTSRYWSSPRPLTAARAGWPTGWVSGGRHLRGVRRAADPRRGFAGLVPGSMTDERANQRGVSPGMPRG